MNQNQLAELFATSKQNIVRHISIVLKEGELQDLSVVKNYFTTAADGKKQRNHQWINSATNIAFRLPGCKIGIMDGMGPWISQRRGWWY